MIHSRNFQRDWSDTFRSGNGSGIGRAAKNKAVVELQSLGTATPCRCRYLSGLKSSIHSHSIVSLPNHIETRFESGTRRMHGPSS